MVSVNKTKNSLLIEELFAAGAHYGYSKSRRHPTATPFILATKNQGDIINLESTISQLEAAKEFAKNLGEKGKVLLLVGTKPEAKATIRKGAEGLGLPYVSSRWIGGTLSNFSEIRRKIDELESYYKDSAEGRLEKYTKKERGVLAKKMERLANYYTGLLNLRKLPDALYVVDPGAEEIAVTEAKNLGTPVVAFANSDSNLRGIEYPVLGNDASVPAINLLTESILSAYAEGKANPEVPQQTEKANGKGNN